MVPAAEPLVIEFSEPMYNVGSSSVQVRTTDGSRRSADNRLRNGRTELVITPDRPLPTDATLRVRVSGRGRDAAGNRIAAGSWTFVTAPGAAYGSARRMTVERGSHTAYVVGPGGALSSPKSRWFGSASGADVSQRATLPNLPGRWLYVRNGVFAGRWMRESGLDHLAGRTERAGYGSLPRIVVAAGTHTGYRFDSSGKVKATRTYRLGSASGANIKARAIINGRPYLRVTNGIWSGYWLPESSVVHRRGSIERLDFPGRPRLDFAAGSYTGYRYDSDGRVTSQVTAALPRDSGANASAWAVINGVPHFLIDNGIWAGTWMAEQTGVSLDAS